MDRLFTKKPREKNYVECLVDGLHHRKDELGKRTTAKENIGIPSLGDSTRKALYDLHLGQHILHFEYDWAK
jgi:hypothetical protein